MALAAEGVTVETLTWAALWLATVANFVSVILNARMRRRWVAMLARTQESRRRLEDSIARIDLLIAQHPNHGDA